MVFLFFIFAIFLVFGQQAVGKMTVGHELEKITDLKLFHKSYDDYIKINNTNLSALEVATMIKAQFNL